MTAEEPPADPINAAAALFRQEQAEDFAELIANKPTVLVVGRSGAGKSTLINTVFGEKVARQGTGRPATQHYTLYSSPDTLVNLYDTRGWQGGAADEKVFFEDTRDFLAAKNEVQPDIIWYVVEGPGARFTDYDQRLMNEVFGGRAVIAIISKCDIASPEQIAGVENAIRAANIQHLTGVIQVAAQPMQGRSSRGRARSSAAPVEPIGLTELINTTIDHLPQSRQLAFVAAQKADLERKRQEARRCIYRSMAKAAAISAAGGLAPIPLADAPFLIHIQMKMLAGIANIFEVGMDLSQVIGGFVTQTLAAEVGKALAAEVLKAAVGVGTLVSAGAKAAISGSITLTLGFTFRSLYHTISRYGLEGKLGLVTSEWVQTFLQSAAETISGQVSSSPNYQEFDYS